MEKMTSSSQNPYVQLSLINYHALLNTGDITTLYQHAMSQKINLKQLHIEQDNARPIAAPINDFINMSLTSRIEEVFLEHFLPFLQSVKLTYCFLHIHCPEHNETQAKFINAQRVKSFIHDFLPSCHLYFTYGNYITGLTNAVNHIPPHCDEWMSMTIDCQTDNDTLKQLIARDQCMTSTNDDALAPGESYVILHLKKQLQPLKQITIIPTVESLRVVLKENNMSLQQFIYPSFGKVDDIENVLHLQRTLWTDSLHRAKPLNPYYSCGNPGAASEALGLLLAVHDCQVSAQGHGLMLTKDNIAVLVQV